MLLRYPLIVLVVFIHADNRELWVDGLRRELLVQGDFAVAMRMVVSQGLARVAVPLMFAIAGYLFFLGFDGSWAGFVRKWKSRAVTLLIPYVAWGGLHLAIRCYTSGKLEGGSVIQALNAVLGVTRPPLVFHLWFIRDLIVMVLVAPLVYAGVKRWPVPTVLVPLTIYVSGWWGLPRPGIVGIALFTLGAALGLRGWLGRTFDERPWRWVVLYALLLGLDLWDKGHVWSEPLNRISLLVGCGAFLALAGWAARGGWRWVGWVEKMAAASFFLYAAHEPLQRMLRSALAARFPGACVAGGDVLYWGPAALVCAGLTLGYFFVIQRVGWLRVPFAGGR
jgi:fucose 4-O-acetylase-like acetyltransferase